MTDEFPIFLVTQEAYETSSNETLGSKYKFWFYDEELGRCLYKQSRSNLGEDWAEKVASELCKLLGLPHAVYELASTWEGDRGVVSPSFLPPSGTLVHGNELLSSIVPNYPAFGTYGISQHTIDIGLARLEIISQANGLTIFNHISRSRISADAINFAQELLEINKHKLLTLGELLS